MKTVIVTGASSGIGMATAIKLKSEGYIVMGTYLNGEDNAKNIQDKYGIPFVRCDVSVESDIENLFGLAEKTFGKVGAVVANAGIALKQKPLLDVSEEEIDSLLNVNLKGTLLTNKRAVLSMLNEGGVIINVSSIFGLYGGGCEVPYSATKAGIIGITNALAEELCNSNVSVCAVAPGLINTRMNAHLDQNAIEDFLVESGANRIGEPIDVANKIFEILSSSDNVNGKIFTVCCNVE